MIRYDAVLYDMILYGVIRYHVIRDDMMQYSTISTDQHSFRDQPADLVATRGDHLITYDMLQHDMVWCNVT